jgi:hypothetical protein
LNPQGKARSVPRGRPLFPAWIAIGGLALRHGAGNCDQGVNFGTIIVRGWVKAIPGRVEIPDEMNIGSKAEPAFSARTRGAAVITRRDILMAHSPMARLVTV